LMSVFCVVVLLPVFCLRDCSDCCIINRSQ
jgi:hypothetical protein